MPSALIVPLVMAGMFTAGCVLIEKLERQAERVGDALAVAFMFCVLLCLMAVLGRYANAGPGATTPRTADTSPAWQALPVAGSLPDGID